MSAPQSPTIPYVSLQSRDRPDVLDIPYDDRKTASDLDDFQEFVLSPFEVENAEQVLFLFSLRSTSIHFLLIYVFSLT